MSESLIKISKDRILRTGAVISLALLVWTLGTSASLQSLGEATTPGHAGRFSGL